MKTRPIQGRCGRIAVLLALTPMMMLNASQAMTLCVSHDGHVAIELLVGDHCTCKVRTASADNVLMGAASQLMDGRSHACSDFIIPVGSCSVRAAPATSKAMAGAAATAPPLPLPAVIDAIESASPESPPTFPCYYTPLCSVILRV